MVEFKEHTIQKTASHPLEIAEGDFQNYSNEYTSFMGAYCMLILDKLKDLNRWEREDFILHQLELVDDEKSWFYSLQSLIDLALEDTGYINLWPSRLTGIQNTLDSVYEKMRSGIVKKKSKSNNSGKAKKVIAPSFTYKDFNRNHDNLNYLYDSLKGHNFIDPSTTVPIFKRIFSGKEITTPVIWIGGISDLNYF